MSRNVFWTLAFVLFVAGAYVWKISSTGRSHLQLEPLDTTRELSGNSVMVLVGDTPIRTDEVEWEYEQITKGIVNDDHSLTPIPNLGAKLDVELTPLKEASLSTLIERKVLFKFIQQDKTWDQSDPARVVDCLKEWKENIDQNPLVFKDQESQDRLKTRLCERSLILQYAEDRVFNRIKVSEQAVTEYYKNHQPEFKIPRKVLVRQILLANEQDAKRARQEVTRANFIELAKNRSIAAEAAQGGLLPFFAKGEFPAVFDVAFIMQPGQISDILKSDYGFHILLVERKVPELNLSLSEATPRIKKILTHKERSEEYKKWVDTALNTITVTSPTDGL